MPGRLKVATDALESSATGIQRVRQVLEEVRVDSVIRSLCEALPGGSLDTDPDLSLLQSRWRNEVAAESVELDATAASLTHAALAYVAVEKMLTKCLRWGDS